MSRMQIFSPGQTVHLRGRESINAGHSGGRKCPDWLFKLYASRRPIYLASGKKQIAGFIKPVWWDDVQSYVGVYQLSYLRPNNVNQQWVEKPVWMYRNGEWRQLKIIGAREPWSKHVGWVQK